jgi:integrase
MRHHYCTLNLIFDYALKLGYVYANPLAKAKTPKLAKHKVDALSKGEVLAFIREIDKLPKMQCLMYTLLLTTGVRRGECFGLQWG